MHPIVRLAKEAIFAWVKERRELSVSEAYIDENMKQKAGVFVSIKTHGRLRGCIGTYIAQTENIATEIVQNAISSATRDPRFPPVVEDELASLSYSVDILSPPERVNNIKDLDPIRYGVLVRSGAKRGLLLPDLEG